jgi:beta-mannosidase
MYMSERTADGPWTLSRVSIGAAPTMDELGALPPDDVISVPATVPGTVAGAWRDAFGTDEALALDPDAWDWWYTTEFDVAEQDAATPWTLEADGIATYSGIWLNGEEVGSSDGAFDEVVLTVPVRPGLNRLGIRCASLSTHPVPSRPRSRWRSTQAQETSLRWHRTPLIGHILWYGTAKVVGPWAPLSFAPALPVRITALTATLQDGFGVVSVSLESAVSRTVILTVLAPDSETEVARTTILSDGATTSLLVVDRPELWYPATHGTPTRYRLQVSTEVEDGRIDVVSTAEIGFRQITARTDDGGFALEVNGEPIFARGAVWEPLDPITMGATEDAYRAALADLVTAGTNIVRLCGTASYEQPAFYDECDRQGVMVWQDLMLATFDPPEDEAWIAHFSRETSSWLRRLAKHPSVAVISGGNEVEQQPTMWGLAPERYTMTVLERNIPALVSEWAPSAVHVRSTPTGGRTPIDIREGVCHYFGVGAYMRGLPDARTAGVRFAAESLAFAVPPEPESIEALFGRADPTEDAATEANWRRGFAQDPGTDWTFADIVAHYAERFFAWPEADRPAEPPIAGLPWPVQMDHHRASINHAMFETLIEWRRRASSCNGAMILAARDLSPGAGFGVVDSLGRPKSAWFAMKAALQPTTVAFHDEGLNGVDLIVFHDGSEPVKGTLTVTLYTVAGHAVENVEVPVELSARDELILGADGLLGGFHDLEYVWRFGDRIYDAIQAVLKDENGTELARTVHLLGGVRRAARSDLGLTAQVERDSDGLFLDVATDELATFVALEVPGFEPADNYFHLPPRGTRRIRLRTSAASGGREGAGHKDDGLPRAKVRALNDGRRIAG